MTSLSSLPVTDVETMIITDYERYKPMATQPTINVSATVCSFDLAHAIAVEYHSDADEANALLQEGWVLVAAGIDANGFPLFILAQSDGGGWGDS